MSSNYKNEKLGEHIHYLKKQTIEEHLKDLIEMYNSICFLLAKYPNFDGIDFCDVSAGGIQIRLFHKEIKGYCYESVTVKYDFSNKEEIINNAVEVWEHLDNDKSLNEYKWFLEQGNKYGWD